ncbi:hypothetical protein HNQ91_002041 [Filimonas zeae]|uniref:Membrane protein n=1 Tax=Filimonas zeae TaxID=1737353 RepID=A0A917IXB5_9BACT|nr:RagB/SusD family nutrient uptake outer membrane protein [Filimonas zeae]MDR6338990.1 hypothetical protein [Filimonas zeae]GGH65634.1 membrane protein [Filimonas zeae]
MKLYKNIRFCAALLLLLTLNGCSKLVEVDVPVTSVTGESVFASGETAIAFVTGIYAKMVEAPPTGTGIGSLSLLPGLSADEFALLAGQSDALLQAYYRNQLTADVTSSRGHFWTILYPYIYTTNRAIEGLRDSKTLDKVIREQLLGEVLFLRAFCYYYLVNFYGDVPLLLTSDYHQNGTASRTGKEAVYRQIVADLTDAKSLLRNRYPEADLISTSSVTARVRPVKFVAAALLARVYMDLKSYSLAEKEALSVIGEGGLYALMPLDDVFTLNGNTNRESIWQLQPIEIGKNTQEGWLFNWPSGSGPSTFTDYPVFLTDLLLNSFEAGDMRKEKWVKTDTVQGIAYSHPYKYKSAALGTEVTEHTVVFRLAEQYLICAEARARQGNTGGADSMLNVVRKRAGLSAITSSGMSEAVTSVIQEKQIELFSEWGSRWLDLKRTGLVDQRMQTVTPLKSGESWRSFQQWYPVPMSEILANAGLAGQQNDGY